MPLALVTGGARRLGAHIAARLAEAGYDLAVQSRSGDAPEEFLTERLGARRFEMFVADLDDAEAVSGLPGIVADRLGQPIDLLINCASRFAAMDGADCAYDRVMELVRTNLAAPVALAKAVADGRSGVAIVNILDQRIANPPIDQLAYTMSKQALAEATRTLALTLAPQARVNGVAPGLVLPTDEYADGQFDRVGALMPLGRNARAEEVADAVLWLAQAPAVTGQIIFVDGGAHLKSFERDFVHLARD